MTKTLEFKAFCFEAYKADKKMTGRQTMELFKKYDVLSYLEKCYNVLHATGREYIIEDIDAFINARKKSKLNSRAV